MTLSNEAMMEVREWEYRKWCRREHLDPEDTRTMQMYDSWYLDTNRVVDWDGFDYPDGAA